MDRVERKNDFNLMQSLKHGEPNNDGQYAYTDNFPYQMNRQGRPIRL